MKILVIGSGGREHALSWKLAQSPKVSKIICAPGNGGTATENKCRNIEIDSNNIPELIKFANKFKPDLTVIGPEDPLVAGIVDQWPEGLKIFGPNKTAARLEGSKIFSKRLMQKLKIPTAEFDEFSDSDKAINFLNSHPDQAWVVKADGLAAGKGVFVCENKVQALDSIKTIMTNRQFGSAGNKIVIEEKLDGWETSLHALCADGKAIALAPAKDHKRVGDGDTGPNTGGMGCYSPVPGFTDEMIRYTMKNVIEPVVKATSFTGVLFAGLMVTKKGVQVLEFNVRFGDPETLVLMARLENDFAEILYNSANGKLPAKLHWSDKVAVAVEMAASGYPGNYKKGERIIGLDKTDHSKIKIFHAGTKLIEGKVLTDGGRVLGITATGKNFAEARKLAYDATKLIDCKKGFHFRTDIAKNVKLK